MNQILSIVKLLLGWPLSLLALYFILKIILSNSGVLLAAITSPNLSLLLLSVCCFVMFYFLRSFLWQQILSIKGHHIPLRESVFLWITSEMRRFIPGNIWSLLSRTSLFGKHNVSSKTVVAALVTESQLFILACLLVSLPSLSFFLSKTGILSTTASLITTVIILTTTLLTLLFLFHKKLVDKKDNSLFQFIYPDFSEEKATILLLLSCLSVILFGIGTYFAIAAIFPLPLPLFLTYSCFFVLSMLVGYLSIITPMGIGVREGFMSFGLSSQLPLASATLASVFARTILIFSELVFLLFAFIWKRMKIQQVKLLERFIQQKKYYLLLFIFVIIYIIYFTVATFLRYDNFYAGRFDLGNMDQTVWNTVHGKLFQLTDPNGTQTVSRLSFHADFILVLLAPLYVFWEDPKLLLLVQTVVVALGSIFVFLLAKEILKKESLALFFSTLYLLNPSIQYANLYDFHGVTLATTFLLGAFYFLYKKQYLWFIVLAVLAGLTKEQVWIIVGLLGLYCLAAQKKYVLGSLIAIASFFIFYYLIWQAIPNTRGGEHFALAYYSDFGDSPTSILKHVFSQPAKIAGVLFQEDQRHYLTQLFMPLGFLPFPRLDMLVFALPDLLLNLLSNNSQLHQIYFQYTAAISPFLFISAVFGFKKIRQLFPSLSKTLLIIVISIESLYAAYAYGPLPGAKNPNLDMFTKPEINAVFITKSLENIPQQASVAATNNLGSHLSHREKNFTIPVGFKEADYVAFLLDDPFAQPSLQAQKIMVETLKTNPNYRVVAEKDIFILFQKITTASLQNTKNDYTIDMYAVCHQSRWKKRII